MTRGKLATSSLKTAFALGLCALLWACGTAAKPAVKGPAVGGKTLKDTGNLRSLSDDAFRHIPANSPFVFVSLDTRAGFVPAMFRYLRPFVEVALDEEIKKEGTQEGKRKRALYEKLLTPEGLEEIGVDTTPHFSMYMLNDLAFVFRLELRDGAAFEKFLVSMAEEEKDRAFTTRGKWRVIEQVDESDGDVTVLAIAERELVFSVMAKGLREKTLPLLIGEARPQRSVVDSGELEELAGRYHGQALGYINSEAVFELFKSPAVGEDSISGMSNTCLREIRSMVQIAPRLVWGFEQRNQAEFALHFAIELREDIAKDLQSIVSPIPSWDIAQSNPDAMNMGVGFNTAKAILWGRRLALKLKTDPYQCEELAEVNAFGDSILVTNMVSPVVSEMGGFVLSIEKLETDKPKEMVGAVAVQSSNPDGLLSFLKTMVPGLAEVTLDKEGIAVEFDSMGGMWPLLFVAKGERMLGVAMGNDSTLLRRIVTAAPQKQGGPFFAVAYDFSKWSHLSESDATEDLEPEIAVIVEQILTALGPIGFTMSATEFGISSTTAIEIK